MSNPGPRFDGVIAAIDDANARDPKTVGIDGRAVPAELLYGQRMSAALATIATCGKSTRIGPAGRPNGYQNATRKISQ